MTITIEALTKDDVPAKARVELEAFRSHPRMPMMWPNGYTPSWFAFKESADYDGLNDSNMKMFKAVDNGEIVGTSEWTLAPDPAANAAKPLIQPDAQPPANWPEGGNWKMRLFYRINCQRMLREHLHMKPFILLNFLCILPGYQGRGIGSKLLQWGLEEADRLKIAVAVESTPAGYPLYSRYGFEQIEVVDEDMRDFGWEEPYDTADAVRVFMIRWPKT